MEVLEHLSPIGGGIRMSEVGKHTGFEIPNLSINDISIGVFDEDVIINSSIERRIFALFLASADGGVLCGTSIRTISYL